MRRNVRQNAGCAVAALGAALAAAPVPAQRVWVVAPVIGPGVDFTAIQPAVDAAVNGDTVLVRAGTYTTFRVDAKSLSVVADGATVALTTSGINGLTISNLAPAQAVVLRGFSQGGAIHGITVTGCLGPVHIEDCSAVGLAAAFGGTGAAISGAAHVSLVGCAFSVIPSRPGVGGLGLACSGSSVSMQRCVVSGQSAVLPGMDGWPAASCANSFVYAANCVISGGRGGPGSFLSGNCLAPGDGADAVTLSDAASRAVVLDCQLVPGQAGTPWAGCPPGQPGQAIGGPGSSVLLNGIASDLAVSSPVRMGQVLSAACRGPAGAATWLALSPRPAPVFVAACNGVLHGDLGVGAVLFVGFLSGAGQLMVPIAVPQLPYLGVTMHLQVGVTTPAACFLGAPSAVLLLDPRY